ncbi:WD40/YVTN/BNR-like repeat-containing protein [candidate division KSB1 bacterium]
MNYFIRERTVSITKIIYFVLIIFISTNISAQENPFSFLRWRGIGPANMTGRVSDVEALDNDFRTVIVAAASGGVFKSSNAGITWEPIFDDYGSGSIGDVAFFQPDPNIIWVGTGEANNRNSSGWGDGIYKSTDGGRTFTNMGLETTHQIARIITHPTNPDIVYVAAIGHLWGYSGDRGLFKTTDGGETWLKLTNGLPNDGKTGSTDLVIDLRNPDVLYTAMYERIRKAWTLQSGGPNGGIFKSTDGGNSWTELTNGLPTGDTGRIGLAIYRKNPDILVANVEADENLPDDLNIPGPGVYRSDDAGASWKYLYRQTSRPFYFGQVRISPVDDNYIYLLYRDFMMSSDGGKTFRSGFRGVYGDPHAMWIDPEDGRSMYFGDDGGVHLSNDGGQRWMKFDNMAIGQYYAIGVDTRDPYWIYGGLQDQNVWGGPSNSRDAMGILNDHNYNVSGGDGFHAQPDPFDWHTVYSVTHVGYAGRSNPETRERTFITPTPETIVNFDDFATPDYQEDPIVYTIDPGEHWLWGDMPSRSINGNILPPHFRYNWSSPLVTSPTQPNTLYFGSNYLFKSTDRGDTWRIISPDLTTNDPEKRNPSGDGGLTVDVTGAENHCTIITISESSVSNGIIWVGTDDGNVQCTSNGGVSWTNVRENIPGIPETIWISRVEASHHDEFTAFVTFDGHRDDDFNPYVYKTTDLGRTWNDISGNLPDGHSLYVIKEDYVNPQLLFVGTEFGCFGTVNCGESWFELDTGLPTVAVYDLVIHPHEGDLIAGTHGRSIFILDDISALQQLSDEILQKDIHLFEPRIATKWQDISRGGSRGHFLFRGENPPRGAALYFYLKPKANNATAENIQVTIVNPETQQETDVRVDERNHSESGIYKVVWNMQMRSGNSRGRRGTPVEAGVYTVIVTADGLEASTTLTVRDDPILKRK